MDEQGNEGRERTNASAGILAFDRLSSSGSMTQTRLGFRMTKDARRKTVMRKLWVKAWITLDGVFDADTMDHWWPPVDEAAVDAAAACRKQGDQCRGSRSDLPA
jgi:hypothetical protein